MEITKYCKYAELNWNALDQLENKLADHGIKVTDVYLDLFKFPNNFKVSTIKDAIQKRKELGEFKYYINIHGELVDKTKVNFVINRFSNLHGQYLQSISLDFDDTNLLGELIEFCRLEPERENDPKIEKSVFIAHKFDFRGSFLSDKVARFLELLDFKVSSGREYSPESIAGKVKKRIEKQSIIFVIYSKGEDQTWLTQESVVGNLEKKKFILKQEGVEFNSGILSDLEYIPFMGYHIEQTFIPILEGFKELKLL